MNSFSLLNFTIKTISDNAFLENRENFLKEQALLRLFRNMQQNMGDCFKRWRDVNNFEKINALMNDKQKMALLQML